MDPMDPLDYIHNSCDPFTEIGHKRDTTSNGHHVQWTQYPMWTQWTQWIQWMYIQWYSMDTMDPLNTMDPLDKNTKLMFTRQPRFGDCVHWIDSDGSIGHPLDNFTDGHHVQWISIGHDGSNGSIGLDSQLL